MEVSFVLKNPVSRSSTGWAQVWCGNTPAAGREQPWVARAPPPVGYALLGRGISLHFLGGKPHPSLCCCRGRILPLSILEWRRMQWCCFPRRFLVYFHPPGVQHQHGRRMGFGDAPGEIQPDGETLPTEMGKWETSFQLQAVCAPHCSTEFRSLLK